MTPSDYSRMAQQRSELSDLLVLGLLRYAARLPVEPTAVTRLVTDPQICRKVQPPCLEVSPETVLTVTPGLQTESLNPRSTKWKRC